MEQEENLAFTCHRCEASFSAQTDLANHQADQTNCLRVVYKNSSSMLKASLKEGEQMKKPEAWGDELLNSSQKGISE
jgi:hypothetical protein